MSYNVLAKRMKYKTISKAHNKKSITVILKLAQSTKLHPWNLLFINRILTRIKAKKCLPTRTKYHNSTHRSKAQEVEKTKTMKPIHHL
jgi:hypothetical protein